MFFVGNWEFVVKDFFESVVGHYVAFLPILIFFTIYKFTHSWKIPFIVGGVLSFFYLAFFLIKGIRQDWIVAGINCFLIGGALMYLLNLRWLGYMYSNLGYTTVLLWIFIVGVLATIFSRDGFIGIELKSRSVVRLFSVYLLVGVLATIIFSLYFSKQIFNVAPIPFIFLFILRAAFVARLKRCCS